MSYSKNSSAILCRPIHGIVNYSISMYPFESRKCGKGGKKSQKCEYVRNEKCLFNEIKNIFIVFERLSFGEKIKNRKNSRHKLKFRKICWQTCNFSLSENGCQLWKSSCLLVVIKTKVKLVFSWWRHREISRRRLSWKHLLS